MIASYVVCIFLAQSIPQTAIDQFRQAIRLNRSCGFMTRELSQNETIGLLPEDTGGRTVRRAAEDGLAQTFVTFDQDWKLIRIRNETNRQRSPATTLLTSLQKETLCLDFVKRLNWLKPSELHKISVQERTLTDLFVYVKRGNLLEYLPAQFTFRGDLLQEAWIYPRMPNVEYNLQQPLLDQETLVARALGYYAAFRPMPEASVKVLPMFIGFPILSLGHEDPPLTSQLLEDLRLKRPFPFLALSLSLPNADQGSPAHLIFVDARSGALYSYVAATGFGGSGRAKAAPKPDLSRVSIDKAIGSLTPTSYEGAEQPKGPTCIARSGNLVFLAPIDSHGRIWLKVGEKPWRAYNPDSKLAKAIRQLANKARRTY